MLLAAKASGDWWQAGRSRGCGAVGWRGAFKALAGRGGKYGGIAFHGDSGLRRKDGIRSGGVERVFEMINPSHKYSD